VNLEYKIAEKLLQIQAVVLKPNDPFTWSSGWKSPIYCDNRLTLSFPEVRNLILEGFLAKIEKLGDFDVVAGVATGGIAIAALIADRLNKPMIYIRSASKGHGRQNRIEGSIEKGQKALVIEDLVSTGKSSVSAALALRETGAVVTNLVAIFNYGFDAADHLFSKENITFEVLTSYQTLISVAIDQNILNSETAEILQAWREDPANWRGIPA